MKRTLGTLGALCILGLSSSLALSANAKLKITPVNESGQRITGALFMFALADDPDQEFTLGENDSGNYEDSIKVPAESSNWSVTKVISSGYLPVRITIRATSKDGEVVQDVSNMELNPGIPMPAIQLPAGGSAEINLTLGDMREVMAKFAEARKAARKAQEEAAAKAAESAIKGAHAEALRLYNAGDEEASIPHFAQAVEENPDDAELRLTYVRVLYKTGHFDEFERAVQPVIEADPSNTELVMMLYSGRRDRGDMPGALEALMMLRQRGARGADLLPHLDYVAKTMGRKKSAIPAWEAVLAVDGDNRDACVALASIYMSAGDRQRTDQYLERAAALDPAAAPALYYEMASKLLKGDQVSQARLERGTELLNTTLQLDPDYFYAYKAMGLARWKQQDLAGAREAFAKYLELRPNAEDKETVEEWITELTEQ
jgi:tetratricopeptide (TPR) repeat protein